MAKLVIDTLTAAIALPDLTARGNDLTILAQALDEDWQRFATDPRAGGRHLISTGINRQDLWPTNQSYYCTQLLQPGPIPAEQRDIKDRFMRGKPILCGELARTDTGMHLITVHLRLSMDGIAVIDRDRGVTTFYLDDTELPETVRGACIGRSLGEVIQMPGADHLIVQDVRDADEAEMRKVKGHLSQVALAIETTIPDDMTVDYQRVYPERQFT